MSNKNLKKRLDDLMLNGAAAWQQYQLSRESTYRLFASSYLLWRDCQSDPDLLEKAYKKHDIAYQNRKTNRINFNPFIQLVFNIRRDTASNSNKIQHWASVLNALDEAYNENPRYYSSNAISKLIDHIKQRGGATEIAKRDADPVPLDDQKGDNSKPSKKDQTATAQAIAKHRIEQLIAWPQPALVVAPKQAANITYDHNGLVALIGRRGKSGQIEIIAGTVDQDAVGRVAVSSMRSYADDIEDSLRTLVEAVHTQTFPQIGKPKDKQRERLWRKRVDTDDTKIKRVVPNPDPKSGAAKHISVALPNLRRLLFVGERDQIIYSRLREKSSIVTVLQPTHRLAGNANLLMEVKDRRILEEPLNDGTLAIYRAVPPDRLAQTKTGFKLSVSNSATNKTRALRFQTYDKTHKANKYSSQPTFNLANDFAPLWSFTVTQDWFIKLRAEWLDEWLRKLGYDTRILRSDSKIFEFRVSSTELFIRFEIDDAAYGDNHCTRIDRVTLKSASKQSCYVMSLDVVPILFSLSEFALIGPVTVSGDAHAISFVFRTAMGHFTVAMPTARLVNKNWLRNTVHFSKAI